MYVKADYCLSFLYILTSSNFLPFVWRFVPFALFLYSYTKKESGSTPNSLPTKLFYIYYYTNYLAYKTIQLAVEALHGQTHDIEE